MTRAHRHNMNLFTYTTIQTRLEKQYKYSTLPLKLCMVWNHAQSFPYKYRCSFTHNPLVKNVNYLLFRRNITCPYFLRHNLFPNKMVINLDMLCFVMKHRIRCDWQCILLSQRTLALWMFNPSILNIWQIHDVSAIILPNALYSATFAWNKIFSQIYTITRDRSSTIIISSTINKWTSNGGTHFVKHKVNLHIPYAMCYCTFNICYIPHYSLCCLHMISLWCMHKLQNSIHCKTYVRSGYGHWSVSTTLRKFSRLWWMDYHWPLVYD